MGDAACPLCRTPIPKSDEACLAMLRRHVENDHPAAIRQLGYYYENGELGLVPSHKKSARLYQRAVDLGDVHAMAHLAESFLHGEGVKVDKKKAAKYYRMAADRGLATAQLNLGLCFINGKGGAKDAAEAMQFLKLAADQGLTVAEYNLGACYARGEFVARDTTEAIRWYERAAAKGNEKAKRGLARLRTP